jgi:DNA-binding NarL/FixJ family response regulator
MSGVRPIRVVIVDDHALVRDAVRAALTRGGMDVVGQAGTAADAERLALELRPDVLLLDITLPDGNGIDVVGRIAGRLPATQIVMLTVSSADEDVREAIRLGAVGYQTKDGGSEALVRAIRGAVDGELVMPRHLARSLVRNLAADAQPAVELPRELTERERSILRRLAEGRTARDIADELVLSPRTVEGHVGRILRKLGVRNRAEAAARYRHARAWTAAGPDTPAR